ncbi:hypothetical protein [Variovorax sp. SRS16]|uniref:hypothetical protein n=1 Tax=Variovorax sp. SRS16 TaxID=282217 RepID=UPI0013A55E38|nr:hypothetical protein [Variovorax sp. SRS16]
MYRAEVPLYAVLPIVLRQGDQAMLGDLHPRVCDERGMAAATAGSADASANGWGGANRHAWGRVIGGITGSQGGVMQVENPTRRAASRPASTCSPTRPGATAPVPVSCFGRAVGALLADLVPGGVGGFGGGLSYLPWTRRSGAGAKKQPPSLVCRIDDELKTWATKHFVTIVAAI